MNILKNNYKRTNKIKGEINKMNWEEKKNIINKECELDRLNKILNNPENKIKIENFDKLKYNTLEKYKIIGKKFNEELNKINEKYKGIRMSSNIFKIIEIELNKYLYKANKIHNSCKNEDLGIKIEIDGSIINIKGKNLDSNILLDLMCR
jgi:hypothetical protein